MSYCRKLEAVVAELDWLTKSPNTRGRTVALAVEAATLLREQAAEIQALQSRATNLANEVLFFQEQAFRS